MQYITIKYCTKEYKLPLLNLTVHKIENVFNIEEISHLQIPFNNIIVFPTDTGNFPPEELQEGVTYVLHLASKYHGFHCCICLLFKRKKTKQRGDRYGESISSQKVGEL